MRAKLLCTLWLVWFGLVAFLRWKFLPVGRIFTGNRCIQSVTFQALMHGLASSLTLWVQAQARNKPGFKTYRLPPPANKLFKKRKFYFLCIFSIFLGGIFIFFPTNLTVSLKKIVYYIRFARLRATET
jgi:hypothetical protein